MANTANYYILSWNKRKQDWKVENKERTLPKARAWAKQQSEIMNKPYMVEKREDMGRFTNGKKGFRSK